MCKLVQIGYMGVTPFNLFVDLRVLYLPKIDSIIPDELLCETTFDPIVIVYDF